MDDLYLRVEPDPLLYTKLEDFDLSKDIDLEAIENKMIELMTASRGIGIAANQVGLTNRVVVVEPKGKEPVAMFNPKIIEQGSTEVADLEGCLSFPDLYLQIKRPETITVEYVDKHRNNCIITLSGYDAKCLLHELDHLDGICFTTKVSKLKLDLARKKQRKLQNGRTK